MSLILKVSSLKPSASEKGHWDMTEVYLNVESCNECQPNTYVYVTIINSEADPLTKQSFWLRAWKEKL